MDWIRGNPRAAAALAGLVVLVAVLVVWGNLREDPEPASVAPPRATEPPRLQELPQPTPTATPTATETPLDPGARPAGVGGDLARLPGLAGSGHAAHLPRHRVRLTADSEVPIGYLYYFMPTAAEDKAGAKVGPGTRWRRDAVVYGEPDYAQLWIQAGPQGIPVTCTIEVDGRVTDSRTSEGPFGTVLCQG